MEWSKEKVGSCPSASPRVVWLKKIQFLLNVCAQLAPPRISATVISMLSAPIAASGVLRLIFLELFVGWEQLMCWALC